MLTNLIKNYYRSLVSNNIFFIWPSNKTLLLKFISIIIFIFSASCGDSFLSLEDNIPNRAARAELVSIEVTPISGSVAKGLTLQYMATGTFSDGSTSDITATVTWTSSDASVATINASGLATAVADGTSTITTTLGAINDNKTITVLPIISCQLGILDVSGINPYTGQPWKAGDKYRLIFVTSTTRDATSTNIDDYNTFVQTAANTTGLGSVSWYAVGSTETVNAITNTRTTAADADGPIFLLNGTTLIANNKADLWDGNIQAPINITQDGNPYGSVSLVYTGSATNGTAEPNRWLGTNIEPLVGTGRNSDAGAYWMRVWRESPSALLPFYGISQVLTVDYY